MNNTNRVQVGYPHQNLMNSSGGLIFCVFPFCQNSIQQFTTCDTAKSLSDWSISMNFRNQGWQWINRQSINMNEPSFVALSLPNQKSEIHWRVSRIVLDAERQYVFSQFSDEVNRVASKKTFLEADTIRVLDLRIKFTEQRKLSSSGHQSAPV